MSSQPVISIIIPTWNNLEFLKLSVASIIDHTELPYQLVIHVNSGSDGTLDWVRSHQLEHSWTRQNVGICHGVNLAAQKCRADYLVYFNDDMYALPEWDRPLYDCASSASDRIPCFVSGTMIQAHPISPAAFTADYGTDPKSFQEARLLADFRRGRFAMDDWNGATWPPCCIHRKWWDRVRGYSTELSPGFYSDIDFSRKLWQLGCRDFRGVGSSMVYHFSEKTTSLVRGSKNRNVKRTRIQFLKKWGILPSTFSNHYLRAGEPYRAPLEEPDWADAIWERFRVRILAAAYSFRDVSGDTW